jgi:hypothetical protein
MTGFAMCMCPRCGFRWIGSVPRPDPREAEERRQYARVYWLHTLVVWALATLLLWLVCCKQPLRTAMAMSAGHWVFAAAWLAALALLVSRGILGSFVVAQREFGGSRVAVIGLPLMVTSAAGAIQGASLVAVQQLASGVGLTLRSPVLAVVFAVLLGLLSAPVIIVRSRNTLIRLGVRAEVSPPEDPRWRF